MPGHARARLHLLRLLALVTVAVLAFAALAVGIARAYPNQGASYDANESPNRRILLVGDSLTGQAGYLAEAIGEAREHAVQVRAISGGAPCDATPAYGGWATNFDGQPGLYPTHVAFAFVGNATSACMQAELGYRVDCCITPAEVSAIVSIYRKHLTTLIRWNKPRNIDVTLVAPPIMAAGTWHGQVNAALVTMLKDLAADEGVRYSDSARELLSPKGVYTGSLAGLPIRHTDGTHLHAPEGATLYALGLLSGPMLGRP